MRKLLLLLILIIPYITKGQGFYSGPYYNNMKQLGVGRNLNTPISANAWLQVGDNGTTPDRANMYLYPTDTALITNPQMGFIVVQSNNGHVYAYNGDHWLDLGATGDEQDPVAIHKTITLTAGTGISIIGGTQELDDNPTFTISATGGGGDNNYPTSLTFNTSTGDLTLGRNGLSDLVANLDGRYIENEGDPVWSSVANNYWTKTELANGTAIVDWSSIVNAPNFITNETDPTVPSHVKAITTNSIANWNTAYNDKINSIAFSGTGTKTLTLTQQDGGTLSASFTDENIYVSSASFATGTGILTLNRSGGPALTVNLDGRYISSLVLTGDVTGSGTSPLATTIASNAVTFSKIQDIPTASLIGRYSAATGDPQSITLGSGLNLNTSTGVLSATGVGTEVDPTVPSYVKAITEAQITNWDNAYDNMVTGIGFSGTSTKTLTVTQQDGGTLTANFTDLGITTETDPTVPFYVKQLTTLDIGNWNTAYETRITGISVTGTSTKTITLDRLDGFNLTANFQDLGITTETDPTVSSYTKTLISNNAVMNAVLLTDGAGSTLDADLLDGQHGTYYLDFNNSTNKPGYLLTSNRQIANDNTTIYGGHSGATFFTNLPNSTGYPQSVGVGIWVKRNNLTTSDGVGSFQLWSSNNASPDELYYKRLNAVNTWSTWRRLWDENNHPAGIQIQQSFTGATVPNNIWTNEAGHVTLINTRTLTPSDIGAAPSSSSGNYLWNTNTAAQSANGWITGRFSVGAASNGLVRLQGGNATNPGYIEFRRPDDTRNGYIGWGTNVINYQAENGATHEFAGGQVNMNTQMNFDAGLASTNFMGLMGDYATNNTTPKIIWTIGTSWNTLATHYGLGYEYSDPPGPKASSHEIVIRQNGTTNHHFTMDGAYYTNGNIQSGGQGRFKGWFSGNNNTQGVGDGPAAEIGVSGGQAIFMGYNRTNNAYINSRLVGNKISLESQGESARTLQSNVSNYTYGTWYMTGNRGGWTGLIFPDAQQVPTFMWASSGPGGGIYQQANSTWALYWDGSNWHVGTSSGNTVWHSGNHPQGSAFNISAGSGQAIGNITTNSAGHVTGVGLIDLPTGSTPIYTYTGITGNYTADYDDVVIYSGDNTSPGPVVTLPSPVDHQGKVYYIVASSQNGGLSITLSSPTIVWSRTGTQISTIAAGTSIMLISDGAYWRQIL